jgi:hypothetical protein
MRRLASCVLPLVVIFGCLASSAGLALEVESAVTRIDLPQREPLVPKFVAKLGPGPARENSGIIKSRLHDDLFWMHNDSGDEPRIYPIRRDGSNYDDTRYDEEQGVLIGGAINVDWEDITTNSSGELIVADLGNNENDRRDLVLYVLDEPSPTAGRTTFRRKIFVRYPDQADFPASKNNFNFDCETVFTVDNTIYLLSKNRSNQFTTLYRVDDERPEVVNVLTKLGSFDIRGQAVGADCSEDGRRLAVLTYNGIWIFERDSLSQEFFAGAILWAPLKWHEAEAICFANPDTLLMADEATAELFEIPIDQLTRCR